MMPQDALIARFVLPAELESAADVALMQGGPDRGPAPGRTGYSAKKLKAG
jgi:hypothetical protein